jgi:hypothetical protein
MTDPRLAHPHDLLARNFLADADLAADLLRNYVDPGLVNLIDLDRLVCESPVGVDSDLVEALSEITS